MREHKLPIISNLVEKAAYTEESYVIDGVQLLPEYLPVDKISYIALRLKNEEAHYKRFKNPNKTKSKHLNNADFEVVKLFQEVICESAESFGLPIFDTDIEETILLDKIIKQLRLDN